MKQLQSVTLRAIVRHIALAVFVFERGRVLYVNLAAERLQDRLRASYGIELDVMLRDHLVTVAAHMESMAESAAVTLLTAAGGEPLYIHLMAFAKDSGEIAVSVRAIGSDMDACRRRYGLSHREAQVAELVLHGYSNTDIAASLGIAEATTKKHLTRIFDKVGINTRSQLQTRFA